MNNRLLQTYQTRIISRIIYPSTGQGLDLYSIVRLKSV